MNVYKIAVPMALSVLFIGAVAEQSFAQPGRGGGPGMRGGFGRGGGDVSEVSLLAMPEIVKHLQDEFELEGDVLEQIQKLAKDAQDEVNNERRTMMQGLRDMSQEERDDAMKEMQDNASDINAEALKKLKKLLSKKQLNRLNELKMQRMGLEVLNDTIVQEVIGMTKQQVEQLKAARETLDKSRQKLMEDMRAQREEGGAGFDRTAMQQAMTEMQQTFEKETENVLTDEQKEMLKKMKGAEFKFPERQRRRPDTNVG